VSTPEQISIALRGPYRKRPIRFAGVHDVQGWLVKLYGVALPGRSARQELLDVALACAGDALPQPPRTDDRYGVGFVIAHDAADFCFVLVHWWANENEIHQRLFSSDLGDPAGLRPHFNEAIGCVYELAATDFERRAWIDDVLANPAGPDVERYLTRRLDAEV
jgi:hypothetical protein